MFARGHDLICIHGFLILARKKEMREATGATL